MSAERRGFPVRLAGATLAAWFCAAPGFARAEGVYGTVQLQYQKADVFQTFLSGDSTLFSRKSSSELWLRAVDLHHQEYLSPDLMLESNVRLSEQSHPGRGDLARTPYGSLRLMHPWFQLLASHQPSLQRASLASQSGLNPDSITTRTVTTHQAETMFNGHVAVPRWPQLDLAWARRRRDGAGSSSERNDSRSVRTTFDRDHYSIYGGVNDQQLSAGTAGATRNSQQVWNGGASYRLVPFRAASLSAQYDVTDVRGVGQAGQRPPTVSQTATVTGDWRPGKKFTSNLAYTFRHVNFGIAANPPQSDHEGSLMGRWTYTRAASLISGGGLRTVRTPGLDGIVEPKLQKYATAIATLDARVRRSWNMSGSLSHTTNWDPGRRLYGVQTLSGSTRAQLSRRMQFDGMLQMSQNGDSASVNQRFSNSWAIRLQGTPLRSLNLAGSLRSSRVGSGIFRALSVTRGFGADLNWRPVPVLQVVGNYGTNTILPSVNGKTSSRSVSARLEPTRQWQWYGSWTRTDQRVYTSVAGQLSSRELVSARLQYAPNRQLAASAGTTITEPGRAGESRQLDLAFTWSFGR